MQLSPIQCTYSNIFIRFFKFFPANTNIYQNSYSVIGVLCGLRQGVLSSQCGYLISFGTKYLMSLQCGVPSGRLPRVINCAFDQLFYAKSENDCLLLVYSFSPRVQSIPRGPRETPQNDIKCVARNSIKRVCKVFYCFSANKPFLRSVRSTLSLRA